MNNSRLHDSNQFDFVANIYHRARAQSVHNDMSAGSINWLLIK